MLRRNRLYRVLCKNESSSQTDPDFNNLSSSEILGDTYQRKTRVRRPLPPAKLRFSDGYPVGIYSSLKCSELLDLEELQPQLFSMQQPKDCLRECNSEESDEGEEDRGKSEGEDRPKRPYTEKSLLPELAPDSLCVH